MTRDDKLAAIGGAAWQTTQQDWVLTAGTILTEPVCPSCSIHPEDGKGPRYSAVADTLDAAIDRAVDLAYRALVLGEDVHSQPAQS